MHRSFTAGLVIVLAACGLAAAIPATGALTLESITYPVDSEIGGPPLALLANGSRAQVDGTVAHLHVIVLSTKWATVNDVGVQLPATRDRQDLNFTHARVHARSTEASPAVGGYPGPEAAVSIKGASSIKGRAAGTIHERSEGTVATNSTDPSYDQFYDLWTAPNLRVASDGAAALSGAWQLKLRGLRVSIDADEGSVTLASGSSSDSAATQTTRWIVLDSPDLTLDASGGGRPVDVALASGVARWHGPAVVTGASGRFASNGATYDAVASTGTLTGSLDGDLRLKDVGGALATQLDLRGDLTETTLATIRAPAQPLVDGSVPWLLIAGAAVVGGGAAGAALLVFRRRAGATHATDDAAYFAHYVFLAEQLADPELALAWAQAGRLAVPEDGELAMKQAGLLAQVGRDEEALSRYEEASRLAPRDSEPDYWAAILLMKRGDANDRERALVHLERAIAREPELAGPIENDPLFAPLHGADFEAMIEDACVRLGRA